ncbi:PTS system transcriptional activator [[Clostridium] ultunense Esp]|nr:PTS system transcriptional activator [[Clostridium] ultunense Esp]
MKNQLIKIIEKEDKKNPLTDIEISKLLKSRREEITILRRELNIPDSRERRKPYLVKEINHILSTQPDITNTDLTSILNRQGFNVSRFLVSQTREDLTSSKSNNTQFCAKENEKGFIDFDIIGENLGLRSQVSQAKAAILYPPNGLNTIITGATGTGKSYLAEQMYKYAVKTKVLNKDSPFIAFNCADYANNPQLLISNLFGHKKGSFTNAINDKQGLVELAHNGILFLDEVHRLPPEGQEMLFYLMDKKKYKKLGESKEETRVNVRIIAATTEDINSSILFTFKRRFPVIIELPRLDERTKEERLLYIEKFFFDESCKINIPIRIHESAIKAFMFYNCEGNIGQLVADIQVACSKGYLNYLNSKDKYVNISLSDLPEHVQNGYPSINTIKEYNELNLSEIIVTPSSGFQSNYLVKSQYILENNIYKYIDKRSKELNNRNTSPEHVEQIIGEELENITGNFIKSIVSNEQYSNYNLQHILDKKIIEITKSMMKIAEKHIDNIDDVLFPCLAFHLSASLDRISNNKPIVNMQLKHIKETYEREYEIANEMVSHIEKEYNILFPEDEIGFIALYIHQTCTHSIEEGKRIAVIVATHGNAAESIVDVANTIVGVDHAKPLVMSLGENFSSVLARGIELVKNSNEGKGFVLLSDMGSLCFIAELISKETGIPSISFDRVDTLMVIEILRKAILPDTDLESIETLPLNSNKSEIAYSPINSVKSKSNKVILALCVTGKGSAIKIKELIKTSIKDIEEYVDIIPVGALNNPDIQEFIKELCLERDIIAIVGTINPKYAEIPYIPLHELVRGEGIIKLKQILNMSLSNSIKKIDYTSKISQFVHKDTIWPKAVFKTKMEVLDKICGKLYDRGYVNDDYKMKVYERELLGSTIYKNSIAIPHATTEETIKSTLGIVTLDNPVLWSEDYYANIVFFLVFKENCSEILSLLHSMANNKALLENILKANTSDDILHMILN